MTTTIPAPTIVLPKEEWPDADFDFPDGDPIHASDAESDKALADVSHWFNRHCHASALPP